MDRAERCRERLSNANGLPMLSISDEHQISYAVRWPCTHLFPVNSAEGLGRHDLAVVWHWKKWAESWNVSAKVCAVDVQKKKLVYMTYIICESDFTFPFVFIFFFRLSLNVLLETTNSLTPANTFPREVQLLLERKRLSIWGITSYELHKASGKVVFPANNSLYQCLDTGFSVSQICHFLEVVRKLFNFFCF